jgi:transposase
VIWRVEACNIIKSEEGKEVCQSRMYTVEPVFGQMKQNRGFREFLLRGKAKVEFVMMCIVHNIEKIGNFIKKHKKNLKNVLGNGINESNIAKNIAI